MDYESRIANESASPDREIDVASLTFEEASQLVTERNHRREVYGEPVVHMGVTFGADAFSHAADPRRREYAPRMPGVFWAELLKSMEEASAQADYTQRRNWVLKTEALRAKLREQGF